MITVGLEALGALGALGALVSLGLGHGRPTITDRQRLDCLRASMFRFPHEAHLPRL